MDAELGPCIDHGKTTSISPEGYALVAMPGVRSRCVRLHRLVYCSHNGFELKDIAGLVIRHTCDNPRCINPKHLLSGTTADNNRDRAERMRSAKRVPSRQRLGPIEAAFIRSHYSPVRGSDYSAIKLGKRFGVNSKVIYNIINGVSYV